MSPDARIAAFAAGRLLTTGPRLATWRGPPFVLDRSFDDVGPQFGAGTCADGTRAVSFDGGGVSIWDTTTGRVLRRREGLATPIAALAPHGAGVAIAEMTGGDVSLWDGHAPRLLGTCVGEPRTVAFTGTHVVVAGAMPDVAVWTVGGEASALVGHADDVEHACVHGGLVATAGKDLRMFVWDLAARRAHASVVIEDALDDEPGEVDAMLFTPDGRGLVTAHRNGWLVRWSTATLAPVGRYPGLDAPLDGLAIDAVGGRLVAQAGGRIGVWPL